MAKKNKKKGGKGKKGSKKAVSTLPKYPPPIVHKTWPGKIESDEEFARKAEEIKLKNRQTIENELVTLRIRQFDWNFHDFYIVVPKSSTIYSLQCRIASNQHDNSVLAEDIILFHAKPQNRYMVKKEGKGMLCEESDEDEDASLTIDDTSDLINFICQDPHATISEALPKVLSFKMPQKPSNPISDNLEQSPIPINGPFPVGKPNFRSRADRKQSSSAWFDMSIKGGRHAGGFERKKNTHPCVDIYYDVGCYNWDLRRLSSAGPDKITNSSNNNPLLTIMNSDMEERKRNIIEQES